MSKDRRHSVLEPEEVEQCDGPCHKHDNVTCFDPCCPECWTYEFWKQRAE